ncbi:MAG TPA: DUF308 domain-containing protein [Thermoanaerobaculia bacterium]|nr:DUF308 domain-containing protein [Thermoanaerobaculia bacterium]
MLSESLQKTFHRAWWALVIRGLLAVALGILILVRPLESVAAFALVIAIWAIFGGITEIVHSIDLRHVFSSWWVILLSGLVSVGFGVAALYYYPGLSLAFAVTWTSFWLMFSGLFGIAAAVSEKRLGLSWGWTFVWGLVAIAASLLAFVSPPTTLAAIMGLMAGFALVSGTALLVGAIRIRSVVGEFREAVGQVKTA